jgi:hypothetical protein
VHHCIAAREHWAVPATGPIAYLNFLLGPTSKSYNSAVGGGLKRDAFADWGPLRTSRIRRTAADASEPSRPAPLTFQRTPPPLDPRRSCAGLTKPSQKDGALWDEPGDVASPSARLRLDITAMLRSCMWEDGSVRVRWLQGFCCEAPTTQTGSPGNESNRTHRVNRALCRLPGSEGFLTHTYGRSPPPGVQEAPKGVGRLSRSVLC